MRLKTSVVRFKSGRRRKPRSFFTELSEFYLIKLKDSAVCLKLECDEDIHVTYRIPTTSKIQIVQRDRQRHFYKVSWSIASIQYDLYTNNFFLVFDLLKWTSAIEISTLAKDWVHDCVYVDIHDYVIVLLHEFWYAGISVENWNWLINGYCKLKCRTP